MSFPYNPNEPNEGKVSSPITGPRGRRYWPRTWCSARYTPRVVKPDETLGQMSEFNGAVCPRSSLGRSFSMREAIVNSVYLSLLPPPPMPLVEGRHSIRL